MGESCHLVRLPLMVMVMVMVMVMGVRLQRLEESSHLARLPLMVMVMVMLTWPGCHSGLAVSSSDALNSHSCGKR